MSNQNNSRTSRRQELEANKNSKKNKKGTTGKRIFKKIFLGAVILGSLMLIAGISLFAYYASSAPKLDEALLKDPLTSELLDTNGETFMKFGAEQRDYVPYNEIPELMKNAILATEDVRFYKHHGMDFWRLGGAVLANLKSGFGSQGASTLTQQVIKNSFFSNDKTLKRKAQEAYLAFQLERKYEKDEIFEMYANKILMSGNIYGLGTASKHFYGKELSELELPEVAMLAGLPQYPNGYNPVKHPESAEKRRNIVLKLMHQHKKITSAEMEAAKAVPVTTNLLPEDQRQANIKSDYPAYVDIVLDELEAANMMDVLSEGVKIQTALDPKAQQSVERALNTNELYETETMQAGMTVLNTKTGEIVAIGGGRNYSGRDLNFASDQKRQPGSVIKPILSYGPAIEYLDWSTAQKVVDEPYNYKGTNKAIRNVDGKYQGPQSIRLALSNSRNIPAVKTFEEVGPSQASDFAKGLGLPYNKVNSSNSLGGGEYNFSTIQMAGAYSAFGNSGIYTPPHAVKKIIFRDGKTERSLTPDSVNSMKDSTAYMITDILRDTISSGTGKLANISGLDVAGKTGTTNYPSEIIKKHDMKNNYVPDSWFTGYTSDYTISTWGGYKDYTTPITTVPKGRQVPQKLFKMVMTDISKDKKTAKFSKPGSVVEATIVKLSDPLILASSSTPDNEKKKELFVKGTEPTEVAEVIEDVVLDAPTSLQASYNDSNKSVDLSWEHKKPDTDEIEDDVEFTILASVDGSEKKKMTTTTDKKVNLTGVETGKTYTFFVYATFGDSQSESASTKLQIEDGVEEEQEEIEEPIQEEKPAVPGKDENKNDGNNNGANSNGDKKPGDGSNNNGNPNGKPNEKPTNKPIDKPIDKPTNDETDKKP